MALCAVILLRRMDGRGMEKRSIWEVPGCGPKSVTARWLPLSMKPSAQSKQGAPADSFLTHGEGDCKRFGGEGD